MDFGDGLNWWVSHIVVFEQRHGWVTVELGVLCCSVVGSDGSVCRQAAHLSQPAGRGDRRQVALQTCVYSVHAAEQLLRAAGRPLLAEEASRAHIGLRQVVRLCAALLPGALGLQRHQCLALLCRLLRPAGGAPTLLHFDPLGVAVMLSHGLPTLAARQDQEGLLSPTGSLQVGDRPRRQTWTAPCRHSC